MCGALRVISCHATFEDYARQNKVNLCRQKKPQIYFCCSSKNVFATQKFLEKRAREEEPFFKKVFLSQIFFDLNRQQRELGGGFGKEVVQRGSSGDGGSAAVEAEIFGR